jgi:hypothetical protein
METKERQVVEGEERGDAVLERVLLQREKHRGRSIFVRAGVMVAGGAVSAFAVPLLLAPELGLPLLLFGLRLLALEFDWAVRLYVRVEKLGRRLFGLLRRLYKSMFKSKRRIAVTVLIWAVVTVAVWMLVW